MLGPGDALDRRGDGDRRLVRERVRQGAARGATTRCRSRARIFITVNDHDKPTVTPIARRFHELGFRILAHRGHRALPARARHSGRARVQGARGAAERHRPDRERRGPAADQHAARQAHRSGTTTRCARPRSRHRVAVHDDAVGRERRLRRDPRAARRAAERCGRSRSGTRSRGRCRRNGPVDRAGSRLRGGAPRAGQGAGEGGRAAGAVLDLPDRRAGHRVCIPEWARTSGRRSAWRTRRAFPGSSSASGRTFFCPMKASTRW